MIILNLTPHQDVGGAFNINDTRKSFILEMMYSNFEDDIKAQIILSEIFDELIERDLSNSEIQILMEENDMFDIFEKVFGKWDIDVIQI